MADPFSIITASVGLMDVLWRTRSYVKKILETSAKIDEDILGLDHEINALISVNTSLGKAYEAEKVGNSGASLADKGRIEELWHNVRALLDDCQKTVQELEELVSGVRGKQASTASKLGDMLGERIDNIRKAVRMDKKDDEFQEIRLKLVNYQNGLQILLAAITLAYTQASQNSTDVSLGHLSQEVQQLGLDLRAQLASLEQKRLPHTNDIHFADAIQSATAVAALASINKHYSTPQIVSSIFTGREVLLADIQRYFDVFGEQTKRTGIQKRFIIWGVGGSGKTQFCCKFAQNNRENFWGIFYIDATSPETAEHSSSKIVRIGKIEPSEGSNLRAAKDWLSNLEFSWLLIIDNADDPAYPLENYFPDGERGCILVTTRDPLKKVHGTVGSNFYHLEKLETEEANSLLLRAACQPTPWDVITMNSANSIATALGFLPLALVQAGTAILNGICSLTNYIESCHLSWQRIRHARRNSDYKVSSTEWSVYSSYEVILQRLEESKDQQALDALELLKMLSCFHFDNIRIQFLIAAAVNPALEQKQQEEERDEQDQMKLFTKPKTWSEYFKDWMFNIAEFTSRDRGYTTIPTVLRDITPLYPFDELRLRQALGKLSRMSLVTYHDSDDIYSMHPLVHTWVRERPEMKLGEQALWCQVAATTLAQSILLPPHGSSEEEEDMRRSLLPHVNHVRKFQIEIDTKIEDNRKGRRLNWVPATRNAFGRRQALQSAKFSRVYQECGLWKEAEELQVAVKNFIFNRLGTEHPAAIGISLFLSVTYWNQARTNEAAELQEQVYRACLNSLGPDHPKTLKVMDTLGSSKCFQGRFRESLELHEKAIAGMKKNPLVREEDKYIAMDNLGRILWRYFRYEDSKEMHTQAYNGLRKILGPQHLQTLMAMEDLAISYLDCGEQWLQTAHDYMVEVYSQRESRLGREQPFTLLAICNLARVKSALGQTVEAEEMFRKALPIAERTLGMDHFGTLAGKVHFAQVLVRQKRYDDAERVFEKVVEKQRYASAAREDGDHPDRIMALWYMVQCYQLHSKLDEALVRVDELEHVVATIGGQGLGKSHPFYQKLFAKRAELERAKESSGDKGEVYENEVVN